MPVILIAAAVLLMGIAMMAIMLPLSIAMRFRAGTRRRRAWGWIVSANLFAASLSGALLLVTAAIGNRWIPDAFRYTLIGCAAGFALGFLGLATSHWEKTPQGLHYTPNRWLILMLTVVVTARIVYGFWRGWHAW